MKVSCKVTFAAANSTRAVSARLTRRGVTYASGTPVRSGKVVFWRFAPKRKLAPGRYTIVVTERGKDGKRVTRRVALAV